MKIPWRAIRLILFLLGFASSLYDGLTRHDGGHRSIPPSEFSPLLALPVIVPVLLLLVVGVHTFNPFIAQVWTPPRHDSNPFRLRDPLVFLHFAGFFIGACGLGYLVASAGRNADLIFAGLGGILASIGSFLGVHLCMRVFKKRYREGEGASAG